LRTFSATRASISLPASSTSPKPAVIAAIAFAPAVSASSTLASNAPAGTAITTSSGGPGNSASDL
jgi:hypothetical protein